MVGTEVLYGDYNGHMRPLGRMHFSDSRCLVADHPESLQEDVESHFCPHCNSLWGQGPEAQANNNRCPSCFECPCCGCVLVPAPIDPLSPASKFCFRCSYCRWSSRGIGLVESDPSTLVLAATVGEKKQRPENAAFAKLLFSAKQREGKGKARRERAWGGGAAGLSSLDHTDRSWGSRAGAGGAAVAVPTGPWRVADAENMVEKRAQLVTTASRELLPKQNSSTLNTAKIRPDSGTAQSYDGSATGASSMNISRAGEPNPGLWSLSNGQSVAGLWERVQGMSGELGSGGAPVAVEGEGMVRGRRVSIPLSSLYLGEVVVGSEADWPRRVRLRTQLGKRCRKDLAVGRPGILVKPFINPLDGDSKKEGRWFKKDCSASLFVPRVTVASLPSLKALREGHPTALVLRVSNPQISPLRVRLDTDQEVGGFDRPSEEGEEDNGATGGTGSGVGVTAGGDSSGISVGGGEGGAAAGTGGGQRGVGKKDNATGPQGSTVDIERTSAGGFEGRGRQPAGEVTLSVRKPPPGVWVKLEGRDDYLAQASEQRLWLPKGLRTGKPEEGGLVLHHYEEVAWLQLVLIGVDDVGKALLESGVSVAAEEGEEHKEGTSPVIAVQFRLLVREGEEGMEGDDEGEVGFLMLVRFPMLMCRPE
ncbi:unnamed protein product [Choristocarpus tenellus]